MGGLTYRHISHAVNTSIGYIEGRRNGTIKSLQTSFPKLNRSLLDGIEWNKIFTIGGMSGSGKSILCEQLKRDIVNLNDESIKILSFEYEMPSYEQVSRNISGALNLSVKKLYSAEERITNEELGRIKEAAKHISKFPVYCVDDVGSVDDMVETVLHFVEHHPDIKEGKCGLVVTVDHVLLTKGKQGDKERETLAYLYRSLISLKKSLISSGIRVLFILLSQLNREIEALERKANPDYNYPTRNDLFGSNDIFMGSDYVLVIHKPHILQLKAYGRDHLPVINKDTGNPLIYFHLLKHRSGEPKILTMEDNFKNSKIVEYVV